MTIESTKEPERLYNLYKAASDGRVRRDWKYMCFGGPDEQAWWTCTATEFAAPYLARIAELETSCAISNERLCRIEAPARALVDLDNDLSEGRSVADKASFHDSVMRPIEKLRAYFGQVKRAEKRGQTIFEVETERRKRAENRCAELEAENARLRSVSTPQIARDPFRLACTEDVATGPHEHGLVHKC